jgi:hypothetical protein
MKYTILFGTYEGASWLWKPNLDLWAKYFPSDHSPIISNSCVALPKCPNHETFHIKGKNDDSSFSTRLLRALRLVKTEYVLFTLDDYLLKGPVNLENLEKVEKMMESDPLLGYIDFELSFPYPLVKPFEPFPVFSYSPYPVTFQIGIWRTKFLKKVLRRGEDPWLAEEDGSFRALRYKEKCLVLGHLGFPIFDYDDGGAVDQGKLIDEKKLYFKQKEHIDLVPSSSTNKKKSRKHTRLRNALYWRYQTLYKKWSVYCRFPFIRF